MSFNLHRVEKLMNQITTVAVHLAKNVIVVCAEDVTGCTLFFTRSGFRGFAESTASLPPCATAMEA